MWSRTIFSNIFEIKGSNEIDLQLEGSTLEPFLNIGFDFASLHGSRKMFDFMERLHISVTGFAKITAPSFKNLPGRL